MDEQVLEVIQQLIEWHANRVENLKMILDHPGADIRIGDDIKITDQKVLKGVHIGIEIAMQQLGTLPISLKEGESC